jgi:hypothetical protein
MAGFLPDPASIIRCSGCTLPEAQSMLRAIASSEASILRGVRMLERSIAKSGIGLKSKKH